MLKGIPVELTVRAAAGTDAFNAPVYTDTVVRVENVITAPSTAEEVLDTMNLFGKRAIYTLHIPKGDTHVWEDTTVSFFGQTFRTIGPATEYIQGMTPLNWNRKVLVERIETQEPETEGETE